VRVQCALSSWVHFKSINQSRISWNSHCQNKISNASFHSVPAASWRVACQHDGCQIRTRTPGPQLVRHTNSTSVAAVPAVCHGTRAFLLRDSWLFALLANYRVATVYLSLLCYPPTMFTASLEYRYSLSVVCTKYLLRQSRVFSLPRSRTRCANPEYKGGTHCLGAESASQALSILGAYVQNLLHILWVYLVPRYKTCSIYSGIFGA
jgi:hypothetical protein